MFQLHFQLTPLEQLSEEWRRSWFFLTDGWYWIETDQTELFRYSETQLKIWESEGYTDSLPYARYPVARFWLDFLEITRYALHPIPRDIFAWIDDSTYWQELEAKVEQRLDVTPYPSPGWDAALSVTLWWSQRELSCGHLNIQPDIHLYRIDSTVFLRWKTTGPQHAGPESGEVSLPLEAFLQELRRFDSLFLEQMQQRILTLPNRDDLQKAQDYNQDMLQNVLDFPLCEDWDAMRTAYAKIREEWA